MTYWFTADEHYGHSNIIKHCNRPFDTIEQMDEELIRRFNALVGKNDITVHAGDFCWLNSKNDVQSKYIKRLHGIHIFLRGSHDGWLPGSAKYIWEKIIYSKQIVVCHYCMRTWRKSHYNSWHLFGHSHGRLATVCKSHDIGVDNNNFRPVSFDEIAMIMKFKADNMNYVGDKDETES
jgi:calcineurin-like phosphoesterase family protein